MDFESKGKTDGCVIALLAIIGVPVLIAVSSIINGFALSVLWGWFIVPVFAAPVLGVAQAIGLSMVVSFLTYQSQQSNPSDKRSSSEKLLTAIIEMFVRVIFVLATGWVVQLFI